MAKKDQCSLHKRINCIFCHYKKKPAPQQTAKKSWLVRRTPIKPKSERQKQIDRLHALLKVACMKRDRERCVMCGNTATNDILDVSHIFAKSVWPLATHVQGA